MESSFRLWGSTEGDVIHPADCMHELLDQVRRHKVNIDGNVTTVMVTTLVLEVRWRILCLLGLLKWQLVSNQRWIGYIAAVGSRPTLVGEQPPYLVSLK